MRGLNVPVTAGSMAEWVRQAATAINLLLGGHLAPSHAKANLPAPKKGALAFVEDEAGGPVLAFGDGTAWRRVTDRAVVS